MTHNFGICLKSRDYPRAIQRLSDEIAAFHRTGGHEESEGHQGLKGVVNMAMGGQRSQDEYDRMFAPIAQGPHVADVQKEMWRIMQEAPMPEPKGAHDLRLAVVRLRTALSDMAGEASPIAMEAVTKAILHAEGAERVISDPPRGSVGMAIVDPFQQG